MNAKQRNGITKSILLKLKGLVLGGGKWIVGAIIVPSAIAGTCGGTLPYLACSDVLVTKLYIDNVNAYVLVNTSMTFSGCNLNGGYLTLQGSHLNFKLLYGSLLAAQMAGKNVGLRIQPDGTGSNFCAISYVIVG
jgi:hypothetical protein